MKNVGTADFIENEYPLLQNLNYPSLLGFPLLLIIALVFLSVSFIVIYH